MEDMMNKVFNEDCLETMKRMEDKSVNLIVADFPYFEVKGDFDFIWKSFDEFLEWVEVVAKEFKRILADNGSLYVYGHAKKIAYKQILFDKYFKLENNLKWYKTDCQTRIGFEEFNSYPPVTEHILFYSNGGTLDDIEEEFIKPKNPFSLYLKEEFKKANITNREIAKLFPSKTGGLTGCVSNWINGDNIITEEQYRIVREYLKCNFLNKPYKDLREEYKSLRKKYEELIRPFNNKYRHDDVLMYAQEVNITGKYDHPTQKPPKLSRALIETSTRKGDLVYIPFGGSGVEVEQCEILGLDWITGDLEKKYCDMIENRVKNAKGEVGLFSEDMGKNIQGSLF